MRFSAEIVVVPSQFDFSFVGYYGHCENFSSMVRTMYYFPCSICNDVAMDFDSLVAVKSGLGTAAVIVMDKKVL